MSSCRAGWFALVLGFVGCSAPTPQPAPGQLIAPSPTVAASLLGSSLPQTVAPEPILDYAQDWLRGERAEPEDRANVCEVANRNIEAALAAVLAEAPPSGAPAAVAP